MIKNQSPSAKAEGLFLPVFSVGRKSIFCDADTGDDDGLDGDIEGGRIRTAVRLPIFVIDGHILLFGEGRFILGIFGKIRRILFDRGEKVAERVFRLAVFEDSERAVIFVGSRGVRNVEEARRAVIAVRTLFYITTAARFYPNLLRSIFRCIIISADGTDFVG